MSAIVRTLPRRIVLSLRDRLAELEHHDCKATSAQDRDLDCAACHALSDADVYLATTEPVLPRMRPAVPCPPDAERHRGEGNPHPARVDVRDATEGAIGIGDVACPVPGCKGGLGLPCAAVQP